MTDSDPNNDLGLATDLELELQPDEAATPTTAIPESGQEAQGQWVWQYGAPPPPPPFGAVFFNGHALKEHYRFFGCALLVVVGCLLPWGPMEAATLGADGSTVTSLMKPPVLNGYQVPAGAISLVLGIWLLLSACHGVYTGRHKILPVFLMIEPAIVTWLRTLDAWGRLESQSVLDKIQELFEVAGTGVMLTLAGSTWVALGFLFLLGKVYAKKDDKGSARRGNRAKKDADKQGKDGGDASDGKDGKDKKGKRGRKR